MAAERASLRIGQRVVDKNGFIGTVRYLGSVPTAKKAETVYAGEPWRLRVVAHGRATRRRWCGTPLTPTLCLAGVEWDDPTRGKHDGSVEKDGVTVRLFQCEAGRGSFMKLPLLKGGVSMVQALIEKYEGAKLDGMESVGTTSGGFMEVEFVGEDHIRCVWALGPTRPRALWRGTPACGSNVRACGPAVCAATSSGCCAISQCHSRTPWWAPLTLTGLAPTRPTSRSSTCAATCCGAGTTCVGARAMVQALLPQPRVAHHALHAPPPRHLVHTQVVALGKQLVRLQVLNLGSNKMAPLPPSVAPSLS